MTLFTTRSVMWGSMGVIKACGTRPMHVSSFGSIMHIFMAISHVEVSLSANFCLFLTGTCITLESMLSSVLYFDHLILCLSL